MTAALRAMNEPPSLPGWGQSMLAIMRLVGLKPLYEAPIPFDDLMTEWMTVIFDVRDHLFIFSGMNFRLYKLYDFL
ncbi:hypothetical protein CCR95_23980 [Thiocystis minor]|uniref:hypothetical protein n=1 Tax=Thiocystis minor TaxID=61597 RepID=UPI0019117784|nr:hypothetical protein [Thiocystis minor]MBK5967041.1 hypothetical protein [Thiocystis minor]